MFRKIENKYINFVKFPKRNINGKEVIAWKNTSGLETDFIYDGKKHHLKIVEYIDKNHIRILIDNIFEKIVRPKAILNVSFAYELMEKKFKYEIGDIINNFYIIDKIIKPYKSNSKYNRVAYRCKCLIDGYIFEKYEYDLNSDVNCPVCTHSITVKGINDIATTDPWMVEYLENKNDSFKYSKNSNTSILVKCPYCNALKKMRIADLYRRGFSCPLCSDGISYPNKFAHELFKQLSKQYKKYIFEYSPDWANLYRYDNYIMLLDGNEIIIEMDGAFHYKNNIVNNDKEKDKLAFNHNIKVIRVDCNYNDIFYRFEHIKRNIIKSLSVYFDLKNVDWNKCNLEALDSKIHKVIDLYNSNFTISECAEEVLLDKSTVKTYLKIGHSLNLCNYNMGILKNGEHEKLGKYKPIAMYNKDFSIINVYPSVNDLCKQNNFNAKTIRETCCGRKGSYRGYLFKYISREEYLRFIKN